MAEVTASLKNSLSFEVSSQRGRCEKKGLMRSRAFTLKKARKYASDCLCRLGRVGLGHTSQILLYACSELCLVRHRWGKFLQRTLELHLKGRQPDHGGLDGHGQLSGRVHRLPGPSEKAVGQARQRLAPMLNPCRATARKSGQRRDLGILRSSTRDDGGPESGC